MKYVPTIGLEVHAELKTKSKMFCGCKNDPHDAQPNTHTCPVCLAHPGTLPVANEEAIKKVLIFGQAVKSKIANYSEFDRKNYFYPDIPKAYQISQYAYPFLVGGELEAVKLTRVHLEEDTARSTHDKGDYSLVDFNRAGVPLMELVTEPVIHDAKTAGDFARELQLLLRTLNISDANMERGEMRVEANISVSDNLDKFGTKVEVKNLNSFKSVEGAITYEITRQAKLLDEGGQVQPETRGWDENKQRTFSQRSKETAKDYRYFPDPDIPKIDVKKQSSFEKSRLAEIMPALPSEKRKTYLNLGLSPDSIEVLISDLALDAVFFAALNYSDLAIGGRAKLLSNYLTTDMAALTSAGFDVSTVRAEHLVELMVMLDSSEINSRVAKDLLPLLSNSELGPRAIATDKGLLQLTDTDVLTQVVQKVINDNSMVVEEFKSGKEASLNFLLGQGMKETRGSANPEVLKLLLIKALK
jgi:aspartyl-tRNA(Asn)/glutamyl-tRNA(Gln) amidotransferase subunit B